MPQTTNKIELPLVSYDLAVMLKEAGFDVPCKHYYNTCDEAIPCTINLNWNNTEVYSAPELALVQMWLREVHGLHVVVEPHPFIYPPKWAFKTFDIESVYKLEARIGTYVNSHDSALTAALTHALTKIKEGK